MSATFLDPHSFSRPDDASLKHLDLDIKVDFDSRSISGKASYKIENKGGVNNIILDTHQLTIHKVTIGNPEQKTTYQLSPFQQWLGSALSIDIKPDTKEIHIYYTSHPDAAALQWLEPHQTLGGNSPFLFTQSEAILARTWVPCQDSPGVRFSYTATVQVPIGLMAMMSALNPTEKSADGIYHFKMEKDIPSYLMSLAVGDVYFKAISSLTGVYAEKGTLEKAAYEFADMDKMLMAAEELYGAYRWGRYDVLVLPPSFPFGGMENPILTFATPTILSGDRSLVSLVAHELAHSWSGNLVTNATWNDFWLNEGFTVYFERRIMEALEGAHYAEMLEVLGYQDLQKTVQLLGATSKDTQLHLQLEGRDPDDGMNQIAYEKGYFLLRNIEDHVGRETWDAFVKKYFETFAFQSMTTEKFLTYLDTELLSKHPGVKEAVNVNNWVYNVGIPENINVKSSSRFRQVDDMLQEWLNGAAATELASQHWSTHEWLHFIRHLPDTITTEQMTELDDAFIFTDSTNCEIQAAWYEHVITHQYERGYAQLKKFLMHVGRRKFIVPQYRLLAATPQGKEMALAIYKEARPNYHPVATSTIDEMLGWKS